MITLAQVKFGNPNANGRETMNHPIWTPARGDVVTGDQITYTESDFGGSYRKPRYLGDRTIRGEVIRDSYGAAKQQHTFTIRVMESSGFDALETGANIRRKGRNIYRGNPQRLRWEDEAEREEAAGEKHKRGDAARAERDERREAEGYWNDGDR